MEGEGKFGKEKGGEHVPISSSLLSPRIAQSLHITAAFDNVRTANKSRGEWLYMYRLMNQ